MRVLGQRMALAVVGLTTLAAYIPARHARVDPNMALRCE
jgi:hypothetical protein